jgi:Protein of unknown function (DUF3307)
LTRFAGAVANASFRFSSVEGETVIDLVLLAMLIFQIKHFLCDFVLQTSQQVRYKGVYFHPAGLLHAGLHAVGSLPALLILSHSPELIGGLMLFEFVLHYHVDWVKARLDTTMRLNDQSSVYWMIFGIDQLVHQLTYVGMIYLVLHFG